MPTVTTSVLQWTICALACGFLASDSPGQESDVVLPAVYEPLLNASADELVAAIEPGFQAISDDSGSARLVEMVKTLRAFGYGSQPQGGRGRGGRQGGGRRGGRQGGGGPEARFAMLDSDGDGKLRGGEIGQRMQSDPRAADGEVTLEEFQAAWKEMFSGGGGGGSHRHGHGGGGGGRHRHGGGQGRGNGRGLGGGAPVIADAQFVLMFDKDRDRRVTLEELREALLKDLQSRVTQHVANQQASTEVGSDGQPVEAVDATKVEQTPERIVAMAQRRTLPRINAIGDCWSLHQHAEGSEENLQRKTLLSQLPHRDGIGEKLGGDSAETIEREKLYGDLLSAYRRGGQRRQLKD